MQYKIHSLSAPFVPMTKLETSWTEYERTSIFTTHRAMRSLEPLLFNIPVYLNWRNDDTTTI